MWLKNLKIWDGVSDQLSDADAVHIEEGKISAVESSDAAGAQSGMDLSGGGCWTKRDRKSVV